MSTANPPNTCLTCDKEASDVCAKCQLARYCSRKCQKSHWRKHKKECNKPHALSKGIPNSAAEKRELLEQMIASEPYITYLLIAAARKYLWCPEYISGGKFTHYLRIEYTSKIRRIAPPSFTGPSATLDEIRDFPKSCIPFILSITRTAPTGKPGGVVPPPLIQVVFCNVDTGHFFQYLPVVLSTAEADEWVTYVGADGIDNFPFVRRFNAVIKYAEWRRLPERRDLCDESVGTDSDD